MELDDDLVKIRIIKGMLGNTSEVTIERTDHDAGFLKMLRWNERLRRLAGFELFDDFNRKMMVTIRD